MRAFSTATFRKKQERKSYYWECKNTNIPWESLSVSACLLLFFKKNPFTSLSIQIGETERRALKKDQSSQTSVVLKAEVLKGPKGNHFNRENLFLAYPKWLIKILSIPLLHARGNLLVTQNLIQRQHSHFCNFPLIYFPVPVINHKTLVTCSIFLLPRALSISLGSFFFPSNPVYAFWSLKLEFIYFSPGFSTSDISIPVLRVFSSLRSPGWHKSFALPHACFPWLIYIAS